MATLKMFIVSDIHAGEAVGRDTYVPVEPPTAREFMHPLNDLVYFVDKHGMTADYLVVAGDLANRSDADGLTYAWTKVQQLARSLEAKVVATPGNHDVVTREASPDPRDGLKKLLPSFPTDNLLLNNRFWAEGICILEEHDHRFVIIDTTFDFPVHPGTFSDDKAEHEFLEAINRGGIRDDTIVTLEAEMRTMTKKLNILVLHHHPLEHQLRSHMRDWHGPMRNGGELVELLSGRFDTGRWLILHGHKHIPQLVQDVRVSAAGPVVLCAASLGHHLWPPATSFIRNQFHIVDVADERVPKVGSFTGTITTFNWGYSFGWNLASTDSKHLPPSAGFGYTGDPVELAIAINEFMGDETLPILRQGEIASQFPMVKYLAPSDRDMLEVELESFGLRVEPNEHGEIDQISEATRREGVS